MPNGAAFLPGRIAAQTGPLQRYLPPLPRGVGPAWLTGRLEPGSWVLDPFGASPALVAEMARAGYRVLAAVNNPVARFLIELHTAPPAEAELRAALADLAASQKSGERIEPVIRSLYLTECAQCGRQIEAQAFIWDRDNGAPAARLYTCPFCKDSGERPFSPYDLGRSARLGSGGLHRARALERVASLSDPDRAYAEEALTVYTGRAVYALFTMINHLELLAPARRRFANALLLAAFDQANGLWHYPPVKFRPRQLSLPQRYLEKNAWLALEEAVESWGALRTGKSMSPLPLTYWPDTPPESGGVCLFEGRLRDLSAQLSGLRYHHVRIKAVATALPRPNQAYWTLCALWAGWLWGRAASAPFKSVLRRRRYDWNWHVEALASAFGVLAPLIEAGTPLLGLIGEAEPGFIAAALIAAETAGFDLLGVSVRSAQEQAQIQWLRARTHERRAWDETDRRAAAAGAMLQYLKERGEPASYLKLHTAGLEALVREHALTSGEITPVETLRLAEASVATEMRTNQRLARFGGTTRTLEAGQWWLNEKLVPSAEINPPLADRVEVFVVRWLSSKPLASLDEVDAALCREYTGLFTPDIELVQACLNSYGELVAEGGGRIRLRAQETPATRRMDLEQMRETLMNLGEQLGYRVDRPARQPEGHPPIDWMSAGGEVHYRFHLTASAVLGKILFGEPAWGFVSSAPAKRLIVLPGGRAGLVEYKLRRDQRLRAVLGQGWRFVKFRQVRWLAENESLRRDNLEELLELDPLSNRDPQLPLL